MKRQEKDAKIMSSHCYPRYDVEAKEKFKTLKRNKSDYTSNNIRYHPNKDFIKTSLLCRDHLQHPRLSHFLTHDQRKELAAFFQQVSDLQYIKIVSSDSQNGLKTKCPKCKEYLLLFHVNNKNYSDLIEINGTFYDYLSCEECNYNLKKSYLTNIHCNFDIIYEYKAPSLNKTRNSII